MDFIVVKEAFSQSWIVLQDLSPWLLMGLFFAALLHAWVPAGSMQRHLGEPGATSVIRATLLGIPLPLCSCGVIPAALALRAKGASRGAALGFLISTPQTGVDSILVSGNLLGWPFALFKVAAAAITGLVGGLLADLRENPNDLLWERKVEPLSAAPRQRPGFAAGLRFGFDSLMRGIYAWIIIGVLAAGTITALLPPNYLAGINWVHGPAGLLAALVVALPVYVCTTASVPIAASLIYAGLPPGAALVFLMAGPATNIATLGAVYRTFGAGITTIYVGTVGGASILFGAMFNFLVTVRPETDPLLHCLTGHAPSLVTMMASGLTIGLFAWHGSRDLLAFLRERKQD